MLFVFDAIAEVDHQIYEVFESQGYFFLTFLKIFLDFSKKLFLDDCCVPLICAIGDNVPLYTCAGTDVTLKHSFLVV